MNVFFFGTSIVKVLVFNFLHILNIIMFQKIHNLTEREYWALIGINKKDFRELTVVFSECEQKIKNQAYEDFVEKYYRKPTAVGSPKFKIPFKKSYKTKNNLDPQLTPEQKAYNKFVSKTRVNVENAIGGIKHYNILV